MVTFFGWDKLGYLLVIPVNRTEELRLCIAEYSKADKNRWTEYLEAYKHAMRGPACDLLKSPRTAGGKANYWVGKTYLKPNYVKCQTEIVTLEPESEDEDQSEEEYTSSSKGEEEIDN